MSRKLTSRGFIAAVTIPRDLPNPYGLTVAAWLAKEMGRAELDEPLTRSVTIHKGSSVGPTTAILENVIGYVLNELRDIGK